jgi:pyruvate formate lyase activating enzyme
VTAFHRDGERSTLASAPARTLIAAATIGREAGLRFVYAGNLPAQTSDLEDTRCPSCQATLIRRRGFEVLEDRIGSAGRCPLCNQSIPGVWSRGSAPP